MIGKRIIVVGTTGSGKSTLARELAQLVGGHYVELDSLFWGANWSETPDDVFLQKVRDAVAADKWVVDGNYGRTREVVWSQADTLIWLDYPLTIIFWRLFWRTLRRTLQQHELWNSNRERFLGQFFSRESLFLWAWQSHPRYQQTYHAMIAEQHYPHLTILHFTHPRQTEAWLKQLRARYQN